MSDAAKHSDLVAEARWLSRRFKDRWGKEDEGTAMLDKLADALASPVQSEDERLTPEFRADLVEAARDRILSVWADAPEGVGAETLAQNIVSAQEFFWLSRSFPLQRVSKTDHEAISRSIGSVLFNVSNFPEPAQSRLLGQDMNPLRERLVEAVFEAIGGAA